MRDNLVELREKRGWTIQDTAEKCGVSREYYSRIEHGSCNPSLDVLQKISSVFKYNLDPKGLFDNYEEGK